MSTNNYESMKPEELAIIYKSATPAERDIIMECVLIKNEPFLLHMLKKHYPSYIKSYRDDMIQEGQIAILKHFPDFDPEKGKFSTFMGRYVMEAFKWYACELHGITSHYFAQNKKLNAARAALIERGVREITADLLAEEMGCGLDAVLTAKGLNDYMNPVSIEGDERDKNLADDYMSVDPEDCYSEIERRETIAAAIRRLSPLEQKVINMTYLSSDKEPSLKEVSIRLGCDIASVRRARNHALRVLSTDPMLTDIVGGNRDHELFKAADEITIELSMPGDAVNGNLAIAIELELDF